MSRHVSSKDALPRCSTVWGLIVFFITLSPGTAATPPTDSSADQERKLDLIVRSEVAIDRPVKDVWPHFINMDAWMEDIRFQSIAGRRGAEGEVRLGMSREPGGAYGSFLVKVVRVTPCEQYVLKVTPEKGSDYLGFADFSFTEVRGRTRLVYDFYLQLTVRGMNEQEFQKFAGQQYAASRKGMARNNQNLKALAEAVR